MLTCFFTWPNMRSEVLSYISTCARFQQISVDHRKPQSNLIPLPIPNRTWSTIGVDFIVKLPISEGIDSVMVVIDHMSKLAHFIPEKETWSAQDLAKHFLSSVFKLHGLPHCIVSDRGCTFVSNFWTAIQTQLRNQPARSTAFQPETDGQVERTNATLEDYLQHFVSNRQDDWVDWLPLAKFSYNNSPSASMSHSPFFACHGFHPCFNSLTSASLVPKADDWLTMLHKIQEDLISALDFAKFQQAQFHNRKHQPANTYSPGDLVWLSRRHLKTSRPCNNLDGRRVGPFSVDRMIG